MPRKSDATVRADTDADTSSALPNPHTSPSDKRDKEARESISIEELNLPKSVISRLAKGVLPPNIQIQGNAVLALRQSATVFINYLASHANEHVQTAGKKTVMPADVFQALDDTEFAFMRAPLEAEFAKFNQIQSAKRSNYRQKVAAAKRAPDADTSTATAGEVDETPSKKARVEGGAEDEEEEDAEDHEVENQGVIDDDEEDEEEEEEEEEEEGEEGEGEGEGEGDETIEIEERREDDESGDESE